MNFETYILQEIKNHPSVQPQDIVKLCYQAAFGAEHLLSYLDRARDYLESEYAAVDASDAPLYERISDSVCRVNLGAWKAKKLPVEWLFKMFAACAGVRNGSDELFFEYLETAERVLCKSFAQYKNASPAPVHHSEQYRQSEKPAYRIVNSQYVRLLPILERVNAGSASVIAIDGRAASGKSTMAAQLRDILGAQVIHMDDFFLPPALRTEERLSAAGGNVHYERFIEEVLPHLSKPQSFSYRIFDCGIMDYNGGRTVKNTPVRIVEGSYSCHPLFGNYADITVFSDVDPDEQMRRIISRNGERMAEMFRSRWIPLEEKYFKEFSISESAHVRV